MADLTNTYLEQIETVIEKYRDLVKSPTPGKNKLENERIITLCRAVVHRITGPGEPYASQLSDLLHTKKADSILIPRMIGLVQALQADLRAGYFKTAAELIHGAVFGDFLEMADHLLENGYKDAAAVVVGSTLEAHLRQLCQKFGVAIEAGDNKGNLRQKKADRMNSDLAAASAYSKPDQKHITAWLALRNKAAHGEYDKYSPEQVALLSQSVRDFISRNPA